MPYEDDHFIETSRPVWNYSLFSDHDVRLFQHGDLRNAYLKFGSHKLNVNGANGYYFAVWAPDAEMVAVTGEFNGWKDHLHKLYPRHDSSGIWEGFIPRLGTNSYYRYYIRGADGRHYHKADPYAFYNELRPGTASITYAFDYTWKDQDWMKKQKKKNALTAPWSIYEVHLGSFMKPDVNDPNGYTSYKDLIHHLVPYVKNMGYSHVEFMPVMEYPYDGSWGYQITGFFAATSRFGKPHELMELVDAFHQAEIGVIFDWVPSHFPSNDHGLYLFDGSHVYEYADTRKGYHPDWNSYIFNYKRGEVVSFLISSAHFWFRYFHIDGIRVDAVNSIMRLDFSRNEGEWEPNEQGGNENLEAIAFIRKLNTVIYEDFPHVQMIAEDSGDWPKITAPVHEDGYGFGMKWMIGWMNDIFRYFKKPSHYRTLAQNDFTFSMMYFYNENFIMPLSHDEVVHGKSPMLYKMPGNEWDKFANLRLLYGWMFTHPGGKLLFMGNDIAQTTEWNYNREVEWGLLQHFPHKALQETVKSLNHLYHTEPAMHLLQFEKEGFEWHDLEHREKGIMSFYRMGPDKKDKLFVIFNVTNIPQENWELKLEGKSSWKEIFNTDASEFFGSNKHLNPHMKFHVVNKKKHIVKTSIKIGAFALLILK